MSKNIKELDEETLSQVTGGGFRAGSSCEDRHKKCYIEKTGTAVIDPNKLLSECEDAYNQCKNGNKVPLSPPAIL